MKKEKTIKIIFIIVFFLIISIIGIMTLFNNQKISYIEKRTLELFPKVTIKNLKREEYYLKLTKAYQDQLEFRSYLVKGYFLFQFQRYYGNVVKGSNNQLYSASQRKITDLDLNNLKKGVEIFNKESDGINAKIIFLTIPRKDAYMEKELPKTYKSSKENYEKQIKVLKDNLNSNIVFIDAYSVFKKGNIYNCYYKTDHHITPRCAYLLYKEINKYTDTKSYNLEDEFKVVQTIVKGSYSAQLGQTTKSSKEDLYLIPKHKLNYVRYDNNKISREKVYGKSYTYEKSYMGGDFAYTKIETKNKGKNILFVGSSYTNILEALFLPNYNIVSSTDYRHNKTGNKINYYVDKDNIDYVVFIPSQSNNALGYNNITLHLGLK